MINNLAELYRRYMPISLRYKIGKLRTNKYDRNNFLKVSSGVWEAECPGETEYIVSKGRMLTFPYSWAEKYDASNIKVLFDSERKMPYVMVERKKLYFPQRYPSEYIKEYFNSLLMEQDSQSPHYYFDPESERILGSTFIDVGGAEGFISLRVVEYADRVIIFECDSDWIEALKYTFEPWADKVEIINRYVSNESEDDKIELDEVGSAYSHLVLKLDVEGNEMNVLEGAHKLLEKNDTTVYVCAYHKREDEKEISNFLLHKGYSIELSDGYMFYGTDDGNFRRGMIRAWKQ